MGIGGIRYRTRALTDDASIDERAVDRFASWLVKHRDRAAVTPETPAGESSIIA